MQENRSAVLQLVHELQKAGINVWFDQETLPPGVFWRDEIKSAVRRHDYFIACFSAEYAARSQTYMNEELELAIEEARQRSTSPWFIPVLLSGEIPDRQIGAGRSIRDIHYVDLSDSNWSAGIASLISVLRPDPSSSVPEGSTKPGDRSNGLTAPMNPSPNTSPLAQPAPNIQLVEMHVCSAELVVGRAIREVRGNAHHEIPAYVAFFRNDPTGQPLAIPTLGRRLALSRVISQSRPWVCGWMKAKEPAFQLALLEGCGSSQCRRTVHLSPSNLQVFRMFGFTIKCYGPSSTVARCCSSMPLASR